MTTPTTLRDRAIDAAKQAINAGGYWLPPAGQEAAVDAVLAAVSPATCCVCGGGPVTYRNYREQPFCWPCADCQCGENPCIRTGISDPAASAEAALALLHEGEEPHPDAANIGNPAQWIWRWNRVTPEQRLDMAARILAAFDTAEACFFQAHEARAADGRTDRDTLARVRTELDRWGLNTVMPQTARALDDIRRALEPPKETPDA